MYFDLAKKLQFKKEVERVLHVKGNYQGGILEMAIVFDAALPVEVQKEIAQEIAGTLKTTDEVFKNVRLNVVYCVNNRKLENTVTSLSLLQIGSYFDDKVVAEEEKTLDGVLRYLKKFQARSKLILVISKGDLPITNAKKTKDSLNPFLKSKLLLLSLGEQNKLRMLSGVELNMELISQSTQQSLGIMG